MSCISKVTILFFWGGDLKCCSCVCVCVCVCVCMCVFVHACVCVCVWTFFISDSSNWQRRGASRVLEEEGKKPFQNWMFLGFCQKLQASAEPSVPMANTFSVTNCTENEAKEAKLKRKKNWTVSTILPAYCQVMCQFCCCFLTVQLQWNETAKNTSCTKFHVIQQIYSVSFFEVNWTEWHLVTDILNCVCLNLTSCFGQGN